MIEDLGGVTTSLVKLALDAAVMRHQVTANNIANANTPGFRPQYVTFEEHLGQAAMALGNRATEHPLATEIAVLRQRLESGGLVRTAPVLEVQVDQEMANLSANVVHYQALLEGLGKRGDVIKMAISGQGGR